MFPKNFAQFSVEATDYLVSFGFNILNYKRYILSWLHPLFQVDGRIILSFSSVPLQWSEILAHLSFELTDCFRFLCHQNTDFGVSSSDFLKGSTP